MLGVVFSFYFDVLRFWLVVNRLFCCWFGVFLSVCVVKLRIERAGPGNRDGGVVLIEPTLANRDDGIRVPCANVVEGVRSIRDTIPEPHLVVLIRMQIH